MLGERLFVELMEHLHTTLKCASPNLNPKGPPLFRFQPHSALKSRSSRLLSNSIVVSVYYIMYYIDNEHNKHHSKRLLSRWLCPIVFSHARSVGHFQIVPGHYHVQTVLSAMPVRARARVGVIARSSAQRVHQPKPVSAACPPAQAVCCACSLCRVCAGA